MPKHKLLPLKLSYLLPITYYLLFLGGCATAPLVMPPKPEGLSGIYHRVKKGQTLWRISKIYNVDLDELAKINRICDATSIEVDQLIFIPHQDKQLSSSDKFSLLLEDFIWPVRGRVITSFGQTFNNIINKGINIQPYSTDDVVASRSGKVVFCADGFKGFGKTIIIDHGDEFSTVYSRNSQIFVKTGDFVQRGTLIAKVGSAGRNRSAYLHFEIRKGYDSQNPSFYLP